LLFHFFFDIYCSHRDLHSFPTRRSSDLFPTSPLKAISAKTPGATVEFDSGADRASAAALAKKSDVAIVFAYQWTSEDFDLPSLSDRKSTRLNSSHVAISYAVFCLKKKNE